MKFRFHALSLVNLSSAKHPDDGEARESPPARLGCDRLVGEVEAAVGLEPRAWATLQSFQGLLGIMLSCCISASCCII